MMKDLLWFGIRRAIYSISVIALFTAIPLYSPAQDKKPGEMPKGSSTSTPAAPSQASVGCPGCNDIEGQIGLTRSAKAGEEARLKSLDESWKALEEKWKKKRAELDELIELRSAASKDKELEKYIDDKEYIKKERSFRDELDKINREMEDNVTDTEKARTEIKRFSAKLGELEGCKEKCQEEEKSHLKKVLEPPGSYIIDKTPPPTKATGCPPDCQGIKAEIGRTQNEQAKQREQLKKLEARGEAIQKELIRIHGKEDELKALFPYLPPDKTPEGDRARNEYKRRARELLDETERARDDVDSNRSRQSKVRADIEILSRRVKELEECQKKCQEEEKSHLKKVLEPPGSYIIDKTPPKTPCPSAPFKPVTIGSQEKFGASGKAKEVAKSVFGGLVGGLFGGGGGPSGMGETADKPPLDTNPFINQMTTFTNPSTGTAIAVAGKQTEKGFLLGAAIDKGEGKPTIHSITLHRDDDCTMMLPERYFLYELWANWWVSVSWTKTTYVNNQVVKRESGGWFASGSVPVGLFAVNQAGEGSVWQYFGFDKATDGPKTVGAEFLNPATGGPVKFPDKAVVHITRPDQNPVTTVPFIFKVSPKTDGKLGFDHLLPPDISPKILKPDV